MTTWNCTLRVLLIGILQSVLFAIQVAASPITISVDARANIFGAGHAVPPDPTFNSPGILPPFISLGGGPETVTLLMVGGSADSGGGPNPSADGGACCSGNTDLLSIGGISGVVHDNSTFFLAGLFLGADEPSDPAPPRLHFSYAGGFIDDAFADLSPQINQTFFVGDGLTGTGVGALQRFHAPPGATRLYVGLIDGFDYDGLPGLYNDNRGSYVVTVDVTSDISAVPDPASLLLLGTGLIGVGKRLIRRSPLEAVPQFEAKDK